MKKLGSNFILGFSQNFARFCKKFAKYRKLFAVKHRKQIKKRQNSYNSSYEIARSTSSFTKLKVQSALYNSTIFRPVVIVLISFLFGFNVGKAFLPINRAEAAPLNIPEPSISIQNTTEEEKVAPDKANIPTIANSTASSARYLANSTTATSTTTPADLSIPSLGISTSVVGSNLSNGNLSVPAYGASRYHSLIMGHLYGVFANLANAVPGQKIYLYGESYTIDSVEYLPVNDDRISVGGYKMSGLINLGSQCIVLMTCAGSYNSALGTYSHRTLVFAKKD